MQYAILPIALCLVLGGCAVSQNSSPEYDAVRGQNSFLRNAGLQISPNAIPDMRGPRRGAAPCEIAGSNAAQDPTLGEVTLAAGDLVKVTLPGDDAPMGVFKVDHDGVLSVPGVGDLPVAGLSRGAAGDQLDHLLGAKHMASYGHASLRLVNTGTDRILWLAQCFTHSHERGLVDQVLASVPGASGSF